MVLYRTRNNDSQSNRRNTNEQLFPRSQQEQNQHVMEQLGSDTSDEDIESRFLFQEADPFYDEHADSEDEKWVRENLYHGVMYKREGNVNKETGEEFASSQEDLEDDKFRLSCPCCFTLLCVRCQQHEEYESQFRAVFVTNCRIREDQRLKIRVRGEEGDREYKDLMAAGNVERLQQKYRPVCCAVCQTEVGVIDEDEIYHFCNVLY